MRILKAEGIEGFDWKEGRWKKRFHATFQASNSASKRAGFA